MPFLNIKNVSITGLSACVPSEQDNIKDIYKWEGAENFMDSTGIYSRRNSGESITSADLCYEAAVKLLNELNWNRNEVEAVIFVSQTPDYILPATSCILQQRLGLSINCFTLDISLGCSGWVYALSVIASLMQNGSITKGLLLAGDTPVKFCSPDDKSSFPLFGDAGTATALEYMKDESPLLFNFSTDGRGKDAIIIHDGGFRNPVNLKSFENFETEDGILRSKLDIELNGMDVFSFGISKAPKSVKQLCETYNIDIDSVDIFSFHQANLMMNEMIRKKLKLPKEKVPYSMNEFGNTSCPSIPLTLVTRERERLNTSKQKLIACGFGVGLSWGSVYFETDRIVVPPLIEI